MLSNLDKNVVIHATGRSGSHLLLDRLLINNDDLTIQSNCKSNIFEELHPFQQEYDTSEFNIEPSVPERLGWRSNEEKMLADLRKINSNGKHWCFKSFAHMPVESLIENYPGQVQTIFLFRLNSLKISYILLFSVIFNITTSVEFG